MAGKSLAWHEQSAESENAEAAAKTGRRANGFLDRIDRIYWVGLSGNHSVNPVKRFRFDY